MRWLAVAGLLALVACNPVGRAHTEFEWRNCESGAVALTRVEACSAVAEDATADTRLRALALVQRGVLRREYGEHGRALADFGRAIRLDSTLADAYVERGLVHHERGAFDVAVRDFDAALAIDPTIPLAIARREAALSGRTDSYYNELQLVNNALASDPDNATLLNNRCWLRVINNDDLDAALVDCDAAIRIDPGSAAAHDSRGMVHLKREEFEAALADYETALTLEPGTGHYLYGRGITRIRMGLSDAGHDDLVAAERAEPGVAATYSANGINP